MLAMMTIRHVTDTYIYIWIYEPMRYVFGDA